MLVLKLSIFFVVASKFSSSKMSSRVLEGYPLGFLTNCPGSNKEATISRSSLKQMSFVLYSGDNLLSNLFNTSSYNYNQMKKLSHRLDFTKKTAIYIPGYLDSNYYTPTSMAIASVYKRLGYNFLSLEYIAFSAVSYPLAARLLRPVGKHTAEMLAELTQYGLNPTDIEIIGLSHGAQAIGFIAKNYRQVTGRNVSRLTSLDPSGPCFRRNEPADRIDASDADFVEVIHTNIDGYGMASPIGHVDFYVNGGEYQPGDAEYFPCTNFCSHSRSFLLWLGALLNPNSFVGIMCDTVQDARDRNCFDRKPVVKNVLGLNTDKNKHGIYYLMTNNVFPYAMGKKGLKKKNEIYKKTIGGYNDLDVIEL